MLLLDTLTSFSFLLMLLLSNCGKEAARQAGLELLLSQAHTTADFSGLLWDRSRPGLLKGDMWCVFTPGSLKGEVGLELVQTEAVLRMVFPACLTGGTLLLGCFLMLGLPNSCMATAAAADAVLGDANSASAEASAAAATPAAVIGTVGAVAAAWLSCLGSCSGKCKLAPVGR